METDRNSQGCEASPTPLPPIVVPAMAYVPFQQYGKMYTPEQGLDNGTLFPELNKPFYGGGVPK